MIFEYVISLDVSSSNTGISTMSINRSETEPVVEVKAYAIVTNYFDKVQKTFIENYGDDYKLVLNSARINNQLDGILMTLMKPYYDYLVTQRENKETLPSRAVVHIVNEKPFIPFESGKGASTKPLIYSGIYIGLIVSKIQRITNSYVEVLYKDVMPNS
jgi:hypothetical protein